MRAPAIAALAVAAFFTAVTTLFGSWYTIDQGERGVLLRNGAVTGVAGPGLGFKMPIVDDIVTFSVQDRIVTYERLAAYSRDQQPADMQVSVNYRLVPEQVVDIYSRFGSEEAVVARLIQPRVMSELKTVFGRFNAVTAIQERERLNAEVRAAIAEAVAGPVIITGVQIENLDFSDAYEASIEQRMLAEVEVQRLRQNAEREKVQAEITVTQATAKADAVRAQAQADADAIKLRGEAEAQAIRARGEALRDNPNLVGLVQAERWNGQLPTTMVPGGAVPMLGLNR
ncbi:regulator of protease activity HflC (stomatin/prohibitin superfamily) [Chelatococcus caeni]|uniref:Regulator of protease activity HflC (Stomatin/prohibitin superfamily) n=1 Tax=Chelatococcus caeni TaxID=1348468 RepID=A0A840C1S2_9HYPH|nr:prohibitin family protein [Chelatococcus caeni]MBB4017608.1 regulator of protease activity HflC (stomatin/prohibitin superfamily) [Chelatococcus caeni]